MKSKVEFSLSHCALFFAAIFSLSAPSATLGQSAPTTVPSFCFDGTNNCAEVDEPTPNGQTQKRWNPGVYMLAYKSDGSPWPGLCNELAGEDNVKGILIRPVWEDHELSRGVFDWAKMDAAMAACGNHGKDVFMLLLERDFGGASSPNRCLAPQYVKNLDGGTGCMASKNGGLPSIHKAEVVDAIVAWIEAIANRYDDNDAFGGVMTAESGPGFGTVSPPNDYTKAAYATQLTRLYEGCANAFDEAICIAGIGHLAGYEEQLVDAASTHGAAMGGPDLVPNSCVTSNSLNSQEYWSTNHSATIPGMIQIQAPEMVGQWGSTCTYLQLKNEIERLNLSYVFWLRKASSPGITWSADILPGVRNSPPIVRTQCPSAFEGGCASNN